MKNDGTIHERISQLVDYFGNGKNTVFAKLVGESEANVRGYRVNVIPKHPFLEKIARNIDISPRWLLTGEGPMLHSDTISGSTISVSLEKEAILMRMLSEKDKKIEQLNREIGALEQKLGTHSQMAHSRFSPVIPQVHDVSGTYDPRSNPDLATSAPKIPEKKVRNTTRK